MRRNQALQEKQNVILFWFLVTLADHNGVGNWFWTPNILFITTRNCQISKIPSHKDGYQHCNNTRSPTIGLKHIASCPHEHRVGIANVYPIVEQHLLINLWKYCEDGKANHLHVFFGFQYTSMMTQWIMVMGYDHLFIATRKMRRQQDSSSSHWLFMNLNLPQIQIVVYQTSILTVTNRVMHHKQ